MLVLGATWTAGEAETPIVAEDYDKSNVEIKQQTTKISDWKCQP